MNLQTLATILLIAGTVVGTFGGGKLPQADVLITGLGLLMLVAGGVLLSVDRRRKNRAQDAGVAPGGAGSRADVLALIRELPAKLQPIADEADDLTLDELASRIGALDADYFQPIADGAPLLLGPMGTARFASVFGVYAGGERLVSRAWSAAVDSHRPEAVASLREGVKRIREAAEAIDGIGSSRAA